MTKEREALKLALEALEEAADAIDSWGSYASGYFQVKHDLENDISKAKSAITAIKEALAQPEQEPVAWMNDMGTHIDLNVSGRGTPLYTTPPHRKPLTDEDILEAAVKSQEGISPRSDTLRFATAIEAKLKEKNT